MFIDRLSNREIVCFHSSNKIFILPALCLFLLPSACALDMNMEKVLPPTHEEPPPYPGSPPYPSQSPPVSPPLPPSVPHYAEADIVSLQGVSGNNTYAVPALASSSPGADAAPLPELQRQCLIFKEKLGEGQFGEVRKGLMDGFFVCVCGWVAGCVLKKKQTYISFAKGAPV